MHRVGEDFDKFIANFYQNKIRIKYPVYLSMNYVLPSWNTPSTKRRIAQGAGQYGITATRYDYLRIAKAMMDDWQRKTCEGLYLREIYDRAIDTKKICHRIYVSETVLDTQTLACYQENMLGNFGLTSLI